MTKGIGLLQNKINASLAQQGMNKAEHFTMEALVGASGRLPDKQRGQGRLAEEGGSEQKAPYRVRMLLVGSMAMTSQRHLSRVFFASPVPGMDEEVPLVNVELHRPFHHHHAIRAHPEASVVRSEGSVCPF